MPSSANIELAHLSSGVISGFVKNSFDGRQILVSPSRELLSFKSNDERVTDCASL